MRAFKSQSDLVSQVSTKSVPSDEITLAGSNTWLYRGIASGGSPSEAVDLVFFVRFEQKGGAYFWTPQLTFKCGLSDYRMVISGKAPIFKFNVNSGSQILTAATYLAKTQNVANGAVGAYTDVALTTAFSHS